MTIYIDNFSIQWNDENLRGLFKPYGEVTSAMVMMDLFTGSSRGFGYIVMPNEMEATTAIGALHNREIDNKQINVKIAVQKEEKRGSYKVGNGGVNPFRFNRN